MHSDVQAVPKFASVKKNLLQNNYLLHNNFVDNQSRS